MIQGRNIKDKSLLNKLFGDKSVWYWLFLAPCLISLALVVMVPLIIGIYYSFTNWDGINKLNFVGLINYANLISDKLFWNSLLFTAKFAVVSIIVINIIGLSLALIVTRRIIGKNLLRTLYFMPNLIGGLILGFIWQFIFISVFDSIGEITGIEAFRGWLSNTSTGFWGMIIITAWQMAGYVMVIYIAYLENIPIDLFEAADIDGAGPWQKFRRVIFPLLAPGFTISMFITLSNSFKLFDQNLSLTKGGPGNTTQMVALNIYQTAFSENKMAYGQAKAVVFFIIIAVISLTQVYFNKKREVEM